MRNIVLKFIGKLVKFRQNLNSKLPVSAVAEVAKREHGEDFNCDKIVVQQGQNIRKNRQNRVLIEENQLAPYDHHRKCGSYAGKSLQKHRFEFALPIPLDQGM